MTARTGDCMAFIDAATRHQGDACLLWPYATARGYGKAWVGGRLVNVHNHICRTVHGAPPTTRHQAAHTCGVRLCVAPQHLRWATQAENEADKLLHGRHTRGERNGFAKLTRAAVFAIRAQPEKRLIDWAAEYGVSKQTVCKARLRQTWNNDEDKEA